MIGPPSVTLDEIQTRMVGDLTEVVVGFINSGAEAETVQVEITHGGALLDTQELRLPADGGTDAVVVNVAPRVRTITLNGEKIRI